MQQRCKGAPISGPILQEKALFFFQKLNPEADNESFKASTGWLKKFLARHVMRSITLQGEALSADASSVGDFRKELGQFIEQEGYALSQIFNADETGLWWKLMPSKTFVHHAEVQAKNFKKSKDRVTLMLCQCYWNMQAAVSIHSQECQAPLLMKHKHEYTSSFLLFSEKGMDGHSHFYQMVS